jgi:hypothetical protein
MHFGEQVLNIDDIHRDIIIRNFFDVRQRSKQGVLYSTCVNKKITKETYYIYLLLTSRVDSVDFAWNI